MMSIYTHHRKKSEPQVIAIMTMASSVSTMLRSSVFWQITHITSDSAAMSPKMKRTSDNLLTKKEE